MALCEGVCWIASALFTTAVSGVGFYCLAVALDYVKTYYREHKQLERERLSEESLEIRAYQEWKNGRIGLGDGVEIRGRENGQQFLHQQYHHQSTKMSRGASIFSAYKMSPAFLSCTVKPRSRLSQASSHVQHRQSSFADYNDKSSNCTSGTWNNSSIVYRNSPYGTKPTIWSTMPEFSKKKSMPDEEDLCSRCKLSKKETRFSFAAGGDVSNRQNRLPQSRGITAPYGVEPLPMSSSPSCDVIGNREVSTGYPQMYRSKYRPMYRDRGNVEEIHQRPQGSTQHSELQSSIDDAGSDHPAPRPSTQSTFYQEMLTRAAKEYPFIVPFIKCAGFGDFSTQGGRQEDGDCDKEKENNDDPVNEKPQSRSLELEEIMKESQSQQPDDDVNSSDRRERQCMFQKLATETNDEERKHKVTKPKHNPVTSPAKSPRSSRRTGEVIFSNLFQKTPPKKSDLQLKQPMKKARESSFTGKNTQVSPTRRGNSRLLSNTKSHSKLSKYKEKSVSLKEQSNTCKRLVEETNTTLRQDGKSNEKRCVQSVIGDVEDRSRTAIPHDSPPTEHNPEFGANPDVPKMHNSIMLSENATRIDLLEQNIYQQSKTFETQVKTSVMNESSLNSDGRRNKNKEKIESKSELKQSGMKCQDLIYQMSDELYTSTGCDNILPLEDLINIQEQMLAAAAAQTPQIAAQIVRGENDTPGDKNNKANVIQLRKTSTKSSRLRQLSILGKDLNSISPNKKNLPSKIPVVHDMGTEKKKMTRKLPGVTRAIKKTWLPKHDRGIEEASQVTISKSLQVELKETTLLKSAKLVQKKQLSKLDLGDRKIHYQISRDSNTKTPGITTKGETYSNKKPLKIKDVSNKPPTPTTVLKSNDKNSAGKKKQQSRVVTFRNIQKPKKQEGKSNGDGDGDGGDDAGGNNMAQEVETSSIETALTNVTPANNDNNKCLLRKSVLDDVVSDLKKRSNPAFLKCSESESSSLAKNAQSVNVSNVAISIVSNYAISMSSVHRNRNIATTGHAFAGPGNFERVFGERAHFPLTDFASLVNDKKKV